MKITSASKKVLASALSAAMVVAFAPTVAFGTPTGGATLTYVDANNAEKSATYATAQEALDAAGKLVKATKVTVTLNDNVTIDDDLDIYSNLTLDLNGKTISATKDFVNSHDEQIVDVNANNNGVVKPSFSLGQFVAGDYALVATSKAANAEWSDFRGDLSNFYHAAVVATTLSTSQYTIAVDNEHGDLYLQADGSYSDSVNDGNKYKATQCEATTAVDDTVYYVVDDGAYVKDESVIYPAQAHAAYGDVFTIDGKNYEVVAAPAGDDKTGYYAPVLSPAKVADVTKVTIKNGAINTVQAAHFYNGINSAATEIVLDGVVIAAEDDVDAAEAVVATGKKVTVKGESAISSTGQDDVKAIEAGDVVVEAGTVSATSKATATTIDASNSATVKGGKVSVSGKSDNEANVIAVKAATAGITVEGGEVSAVNTATGKKATALDGTDDVDSHIKAGTIAGELTLKARSITGGTFTKYLVGSPLLATNYQAVDNSTNSVVYRNGFDATGTVTGINDAGDAIKGLIEDNAELAAENAIDDVFGNLAVGASVKYALGTGFTADQVKAILTDSTKSALVKVETTYDLFAADATNLTDEQKAILEQVKAAAAKTMDKPENVITLTTEIKYRAEGERNWATLISLTDLGSTANGRNSALNAVAMPEGTSFLADGSLTKLEKTKNDGASDYWATATGVYATTEADTEAIKDAATQKPAPAEKATQSIDVAQKSKTVKLAKGKTKTQKAVSFKLGASAETELAIAKKSGSSRITVSGQKVTLKKGTKKGAFTAKVSLKAAGSDEFLAAAKTITVKFVVKK